jgi:hypothetical protein
MLLDKANQDVAIDRESAEILWSKKGAPVFVVPDYSPARIELG